ncbi:hypothetical protein ACQE3E_07035 [Methylomonas sp. MED-D]|uniref:hypothetical protein n=1 Tax=Methylomonas TaxID=416 RepID=UPI000AA6B5F3|nr:MULTISPECIES: hypothetical protein [Methylomonas]MDT4329333.1 hypothetical protein [Methylomonas sp. MV1]WGS86886.1 hypothetical protein QC632_03805 [Methylomonas sp. UP202]
MPRFWFFILIISLNGCDVFYIKRLDFQRPSEFSFVSRYEANKAEIISAVENYALANNMSCSVKPSVLLDCSLQPKDVVVFEDANGVSICLFMLGISWEAGDFNQFTELIKNLIHEKLRYATLNNFSEKDDCNNIPMP